MALTWLITGCSSGFGFSIAKEVLRNGHNVIATSRNPSKNADLVSEITSSPRGKWMALDVTAPLSDMQATVAEAEKLFGNIDVLVNNAGYGAMGALEDLTEEQYRSNFETNFFGPMKLIKATLPSMRARRSGTIVNMSSVAGLLAMPTASSYSGSKWALEALSESLSAEVASFNIRVLLVEPGLFRTNFFSAGGMHILEPYKGTAVEDVDKYFMSTQGKEPGDPEKAAARIFEAVTGTGMSEGKTGHLRLLLGKNCIRRARAQQEKVKANFDAMDEIAVSADFEDRA